jgi:hypothetical protein
MENPSQLSNAVVLYLRSKSLRAPKDYESHKMEMTPSPQEPGRGVRVKPSSNAEVL